MNPNELSCVLEAVLFASGDPMQIDRLCTVLGCDRESLESAAKALSDMYDSDRRGIKLLRLEDRLQLCSRADYSRQVRAALEVRKSTPLSQSSLETLAIVAYKQPVTKVYIEQVRGVDSSYTVNSLIEKGFIEEAGKLDAPGRPNLYVTTDKFLRVFGISSLDELPSREELEGLPKPENDPALIPGELQ